MLLLYLFIKLRFLYIQARLFLGFTTLRKGGCELQLKKMWYTSKKYKRKLKNKKCQKIFAIYISLSGQEHFYNTKA